MPEVGNFCPHRTIVSPLCFIGPDMIFVKYFTPAHFPNIRNLLFFCEAFSSIVTLVFFCKPVFDKLGWGTSGIRYFLVQVGARAKPDHNTIYNHPCHSFSLLDTDPFQLEKLLLKIKIISALKKEEDFFVCCLFESLFKDVFFHFQIKGM